MGEEKEGTEAVVYKSLSDEKIKELALGIHEGKIMTSEHIKDDEEIPRVFIALQLGVGTGQTQWMVDNDISVVYEYMDKAGNLTVNGMPRFLSCRFLSSNDWVRVVTKVDQIKAALEAV